MKISYSLLLALFIFGPRRATAQASNSPDASSAIRWTPPLLKPIAVGDALPTITDVNNTGGFERISSESVTTTENPKYLDAEARLLNLWRSQRNTARPRRHFWDKVYIQMGFGLFKISQIQEDLHMAVLHGWTMMIWYDEYHRWNVSEYGGLQAVSVPPDMVWRPDIVQYSAATRDKTVNIFGNMNVNVFANGRVLWAPSTTISVQMSPQKDTSWPHDQHHISFKLGTWSHGTSAVNLIPASESLLRGGMADTSEYVEGPRWNLLNFTGRAQKETFKCCPGARISMMTFDLTIERKSNFMFHLIGWPLKLVLFSSCAIFFLPIAAVSFRLLLCGIYFMTYAVLLAVLQQVLPRGAIYGTNVPLPAAAVVCAIALMLADVCAVIVIGAAAKINKYRFPGGWTATVLHTIAKGMLLDPHRVVHDADAVAMYHRMDDDSMGVAVLPNRNGATTNGAYANGTSNGSADAVSPWTPAYTNGATLPVGVNAPVKPPGNDWRLLAAVLNRFAFIVNLILCIVITAATP